MEMIFNNIIIKKETLDFKIKSEEINGITGDNNKELVEIINLKKHYNGEIIIDDVIINDDNIKEYKNKIDIIKEELYDDIYTNTTYDLIKEEIIKRKLKVKDIKKKIHDSLKIVGLEQELLERSINTLSTSEKKLIQLAISLISNKEVIIIIEPFKVLDIIKEKKVWLLIQKLKEQYHKTIVLVSDDCEMLYKYTNHIIIAKNSKILVEGKTTDIYKRVDLLTKNNIEIPEIVEITYKAKKQKKVKIDYHKDVRDIIKDIYKHV